MLIETLFWFWAGQNSHQLLIKEGMICLQYKNVRSSPLGGS